MSQLKQKLRRMHKQGFVNEPDTVTERESFAAQLQKRRITPPKQLLSDEQLAQHLSASLSASTGGYCEFVEPGLLRIRHSHSQFVDWIPHALFHQLGVEQSSQLLFFDTETTGLSHGSGTLVWMVGMAYWEHGVFYTEQLLLTRYSGERAMLDVLNQRFARFHCLVSYNGKPFDLSLIQNRFRMQQMDLRVSPQHIDLLFWFRYWFKDTWPNARLQTAEQQLLQFHRQQDLAGAESPLVWAEWQRWQIWQRIPQMLTHNYWDVLNLAKLLIKTVDILRVPHDFEANLTAVSNTIARVQGVAAASQFLQQHQLKRSRDKLTLARLFKKQKQNHRAAELWLSLQDQADVEVLRELSAYFEHHQKDYSQALAYCQRMLALQPQDEAVAHRLRRLQGKQTKIVS